jgi:SAM-dependent methyltransferase
VSARPVRESTVYDRIGRGYVVSRRPDARIAAAIRAAIGRARTVVNVGAGTGSYEPADVGVLAVEPSIEMIRQRPAGAARALRGAAEHLPFADRSFDAALAVLTVHHWPDRAAGLAELARVTRDRVVILTWDPAFRHAFWLTSEYVPAITELDVARFPALAEIGQAFDRIEARPLAIPHDCADGFLGAFWCRPEAYLDPNVRRAMSGFTQLPRGAADEGLARLEADLASGRWNARFGHLRRQVSADLGYRLIVAEPR